MSALTADLTLCACSGNFRKHHLPAECRVWPGYNMCFDHMIHRFRGPNLAHPDQRSTLNLNQRLCWHLKAYDPLTQEKF